MEFIILLSDEDLSAFHICGKPNDTQSFVEERSLSSARVGVQSLPQFPPQRGRHRPPWYIILNYYILYEEP